MSTSPRHPGLPDTAPASDGPDGLPPVPDAGPQSTARLREAFLDTGFTADGLLELLGASAYSALARNETVPALRATRSVAPLPTLVRLFLLQQSVPAVQAADALPLQDALADGWLVRDDSDDTVRATLDIRPYGGPDGEEWWIAADLGCAVGGAGGIGARHTDVVLGVGGASTTLAGITVPRTVGRALDLGTGSGIQALHVSRHAGRVTATDVNPRASAFTRLTLALSGAPEADLREGSLLEPVEGEEPYELIVSNPPFVISPRTGDDGGRLTYRDGGMGGDDLCRTLVEQAPRHLADGGYCQLLANWEHREDEEWTERVRSWVPEGCDAWIVQREVQDVAQYTELWLRDAGVHEQDPREYARQYGVWLDEFARRGTRSVGFGWITLRPSGGREPVVVAEEWPHAVQQPLGAEIEAHFARQDFLRGTDDAALLDRHFRLAADVTQEQVGRPGAEDPEHVVFRRSTGMCRATKVDGVTAGFAGACDGTLTAGQILDAIAQLVEEDPVVLRDRTPEAIRLLVEQGFLDPA